MTIPISIPRIKTVIFGSRLHEVIMMLIMTIPKKELKRNVEIEKKEMLQEKILKQFEKEYFVKTLNIPENYINGFLFYACEDKSLVELFKGRDKMMQMFKLSDLATEYLKTIETESSK